MIFLRHDEALKIQGLHFSPQHHVDSKGKPKRRIIGDLTGQHDPSSTPLNGSAHDKDQLRTEKKDLRLVATQMPATLLCLISLLRRRFLTFRMASIPASNIAWRVCDRMDTLDK